MASILFIAPLPPPITGQSLASLVLYDFIRAAHDVTLVNLSKKSLRSGFSSFGRLLSLVRIFVAILRGRNSDVIYFTISESRAGNLKDILIYMLCFGRLHRMILHLHGGAGMRRLLAPTAPMSRLVNKLFLAQVRSVVVLGDRHRSIFSGVLREKQLKVVKNFASDELFVIPNVVQHKFAASGPLRVVYLSNLIPGKGYIELLNAYKMLDEPIRRRIVIAFAGAFESERDKSAFLAAIEGVSNVQYHGVVKGECKKALLREAHVFCLPTYYPFEGQPISILEAYASGCAVITTDHSGILDIFADCQNGILVEQRSPTSIRDALLLAMANRDRLMRWALCNLELARNEYRSANYIRALSAVLFSRECEE